MGREYKSDPHGKRYRKLNSTDLLAAVNCIKTHKVSYREAVEKSMPYGIHYSVIYRHVKNPNIKTRRGQTALTTLEENSVVSSVLLRAQRGYPLDKFDIRYLVKGYLDGRGNILKKFRKNMPAGSDWIDDFLTRHNN